MTMTATDFARGGVSTELLRVVDLAKHYGEEAAIAGVTFSAAAGEVLGIVGPNGAGKTTLLEATARAGRIHDLLDRKRRDRYHAVA
jgi:ABC-2 type transport system ATP-binding protein